MRRNTWKKPEKKRNRLLGRLGFGLTVALLLAGSFAVGSYWVAGKGPFGGSRAEQTPAGGPGGGAKAPGTVPGPLEAPEIRMAEPEVRFTSHSANKTDAYSPGGTASPEGSKGDAPAVPEDDVVYAVQVGAFRNPDDAHSLTKRLTNRGYTAYIVIAEVPSQGMLHKVRVGRYPARSAADRMAKTILQKEGLQSFVTYR